MKTFKEFIAEAESSHTSYGKWGAMHHETGELIDGLAHPTATIHSDLDKKKNVPLISWAHEYPHIGLGYSREADSSWGWERGGKPHNKPKLNIRTYGKAALGTALKHFNKFPPVPGQEVEWDHYTGRRSYSTEHRFIGHQVGAVNSMTKHHKKISKP